MIDTALVNKLDYTFRRGEIGMWKEYFTEEHLNEFEKRFGELQMAFGYPIRESYTPLFSSKI